MKTLANISLSIAGFFVVVATFFAGQATAPKQIQTFGAAQGRDGFTYATSTQVNTSTSSAAAVLSGNNANRVYAYIKNLGPSTVSCGMSTSTAVNKGWILTTSTDAGSILKFDGSVVPTGQIYCITASGAATTSIVSIIEAGR